MDNARLGYLGDAGSFSHQAAQQLAGAGEVLVGLPSLYAVLEALEKNEVRAAVVPFENSTTGLIRPIVDTLLGQSVWIQSVLHQSVAHHLVRLGSLDLNLSDPLCTGKDQEVQGARLYVQREAYDQCRGYLRERSEMLIYTESTSDALAVLLRSCDAPSLAVVNCHQLKEMAGSLEVIAAHIEDHPCNHTRFARLCSAAREHCQGAPLALGRHWLLRVDLEHRPGALARLLSALARVGIDVLALHSRPIPESPGRYRFVLELEAPQPVEGPWLSGVLEEGACLAVQWLGGW